MRYCALYRVQVGNGTQTYVLKKDLSSRKEALDEAIRQWPMAKDRIRVFSFTTETEEDKQMSYSTDKAKLSNQERTTGDGARSVNVLKTASQQLRVAPVKDRTRSPKQHQSRILLPTQAPAPKTYGTRSPASRSVGKGQN